MRVDPSGDWPMRSSSIKKKKQIYNFYAAFEKKENLLDEISEL